VSASVPSKSKIKAFDLGFMINSLTVSDF